MAIPVTLARLAIRVYQLITIGWPRRCRFAPSCSDYCREALERFGFWKGLAFGGQRLLKCHPWHPGGYDPIRSSAWSLVDSVSPQTQEIYGK